MLVPLCTVNSVPSVLFTLKASHMNTHAGEVRQVLCVCVCVCECLFVFLSNFVNLTVESER